MASSQELFDRVQHLNNYTPQISFATVKPYPNFDANEDANSLDKAIQAKGVDEHIIISMLANRTNMQRQQIADAYKQAYGKDLSQSLNNVLSGKLKDVTLGLLQTPSLFDTHALKNTMKGLGTDEESLVEILSTCTNQEKKAITDIYQTEFKCTVADDIASDCSGELQKLSLALAKTLRSEQQTLDYKKIDEDAKVLYNGGAKRKDAADVDKFIAILAGRSNRHLQRVFEKYTTLCPKEFVQSLEQDTKGEVCRAYVGLVKAIQNTPAFFAERLHQAIEGKKDNNLLRILVSRSEKDLLAIRTQYKKKYGVSLYSAIAEKTKGDFKNVLLALCGQDDL
uniref:annexin A2-like n=1 Tax=Myxine glutinosa TaxID=7769 RepID=UPI00358FC2EC